jgi:biotin carboxyl carrier protein
LVVTDVAATIFVAGEGSAWSSIVEHDQVRLVEADTTCTVVEQEDGRYRVTGPDGTMTVSAARTGDAVWIGLDGYVLELRVGAMAAERPSTRDTDSLAPLMSATVVKIHVRPGDRVQEGDTLVTLEAMKMEMPIKAPRAATISAIHCAEGTLAPAGAPVVTLRD